jgi:hypothetical protein
MQIQKCGEDRQNMKRNHWIQRLGLAAALAGAVVLLGACAHTSAEKPAATVPVPAAPTGAPEQSGGETEMVALPVRVQYIRTNGYLSGAVYPQSRIIASREALLSYYEENRDKYDLARKDKVYADTTVGFLDAIDRYDEAFFRDHSLLVVLLEEGSGSVRHEVTGVRHRPGRYNVEIQRKVPEVGTDDMAEWHLLIEVARTAAPEAEELVALKIETARSAAPAAPALREDRCALYLQVLEDLWEVDPGLNHGIERLGFDLSKLSHLDEREKERVMAAFAEKHGLPYVTGTWEALCEQGYIDREKLLWEDGLFFCIETDEEAVWNLPALRAGEQPPELTAFNAHKWRSGLGAYFFGNCAAQRNADGAWTYSVGQEAIS